MSYNIRNIEGGDSYLNDPLTFEYSNRQNYVVSAISDESPDIVCLQEATVKEHKNPFASPSSLSWYDTLDKTSGLTGNGYTLYKGTAITVSDYKKDYNPIFYKTARYNNIASGTEILSESKNSINWIVLETKAGGQRFIVVNTHLPKNDGSKVLADYRIAQTNAIIALITTLKATYDYPVIIAGDFNDKVNASTSGKILADAGYTDSIAPARTKVNETSSTYVKSFQICEGDTIDHIFTKDLPEYAYISYYETVDNKDITGSVGKYPSDHLPVVVIIKYLPANN